MYYSHSHNDTAPMSSAYVLPHTEAHFTTTELIEKSKTAVATIRIAVCLF